MTVASADFGVALPSVCPSCAFSALVIHVESFFSLDPFEFSYICAHQIMSTNTTTKGLVLIVEKLVHRTSSTILIFTKTGLA